MLPTSCQSTNFQSTRASKTLPVSTPFLQTLQTSHLLIGTTASELCGRDRAVLPRGTICSGPCEACFRSSFFETTNEYDTGVVFYRVD
ncbi:unnamed protein product [Protopolystoma xenopodis]|uniref:Uncharacterized protein n=1 Tax=Protopolystoma xenopodis TaxID=117903 RepID=A0A3S5C599_9PLAT|nr:unnamed protein product [Protopolystoma xenopodis]